MPDDAFFLPEGDGAFVATEITRGPWDPRFQHGGPPCALLAREVERAAGPGWFPARLCVELRRPIPIGRVVVRSERVHAGRSVCRVDAALSAADAPAAVARGLFLRPAAVDLPEVPRDPPLATPPEALPWTPFDFFGTGMAGYHQAVEVRFVQGAFHAGATKVWMRVRGRVVEGEAISPLQQVAAVADSINGLSMVLDFDRFTFLNADLDIALWRLPADDWTGLASATHPDEQGVGLGDGRLYDRRGPIGRATQALVVRRR